MQQHRTEREELANTLTHGIGALASAIGGVVLVGLALAAGDIWQIVSAVVYSISLVLLYSASTFYHAARGEVVKQRLEILDHAAIFILIAGTYTPFTLITLRGSWGWWLFGVIWGLAVAGVILKLFYTRRFRLLSTMVYIGMGWLAVVVAGPMIQALSPSVIALLVIGGITYTAGTIFYHNHHIPYAHTIWHLFVLGGSACHFFAVASQI